MDGLKPGEYGFLLLTSCLGAPERKPLTAAQLRTLMERSDTMKRTEPSRDVDANDFISMGYGPKMAQHMASLLGDEPLLKYYLMKAKKAGCVPITRATPEYPLLLRKRLGLESPGVLWAKGDVSLLSSAAVALVGSRELREENRRFAAEVGRQAARQGLTLVSGNARGADKTAQNACLEAGGRVISVVADGLADKTETDNVLYLSEDSFDVPFSAPRALSRNRVIHSLGWRTFVAQTAVKTGGTWDGTVKNLRLGWSGVYCFDDGSEGPRLLEQMGAFCIDMQALEDFGSLPEKEMYLFDR